MRKIAEKVHDKMLPKESVLSFEEYVKCRHDASILLPAVSYYNLRESYANYLRIMKKQVR